MFEGLDYEAVLEERERPPFDTEVPRVEAEMKALLHGPADPSPNPHAVVRLLLPEGEGRQLVEAIVDLAFTKAAPATGGHELCDEVGEDFGRIAAALWLGYSDPWLNGVWVAYASGKFPTGAAEPVEDELTTLVLGGA
jgi:hypothetical protein